MSSLTIFAKKHLRICYWNAEPRFVFPGKMALEKKLGLLGDVTFVELQSLDDKNFHPCDLLIIAGGNLDDEAFTKWITAVRKRVKQQGKIWTPALILASISFSTLDENLVEAVKSNWYFDVLNADHLESLPIRVANLLRIHDHLHELRRYDEQLEVLNEQVEELQRQLLALGKNP